jgi:hypothetical protein
MFVKNADGERLDLAERHRAESASAFQAKVEAANAGKKRENVQGHAAAALSCICIVLRSSRSTVAVRCSSGSG